MNPSQMQAEKPEYLKAAYVIVCPVRQKEPADMYGSTRIDSPLSRRGKGIFLLQDMG